MEKTIKIFLDKINIGEEYFQYFNAAKISKVKVNSKKNSWNIFIDIDKLLPIEVYEKIDEPIKLENEPENKIFSKDVHSKENDDKILK